MKDLCVALGLLLLWTTSFSQNNRDLDDLFLDYRVIQNSISPQVAGQNAASFKVDFRDISSKIGNIQIEEVDIYQRGYTLTVSEGDGIKKTRPNQIKAYRSTDPRYPIRVTADDEFAYGYVADNSTRIFFEPLSHFDPNAGPNDLIVYDEDAVKDKALRCGATEDLHMGDVAEADDGDDFKSNGVCRVVEVAIASDYSMYQAYGSIQAVENHAIGVLNNVQGNYDDEFGDMLEFKLVEQYVSTCSSCDPWTTSVNANGLLADFSNWGPSGFTQNHDVATLWTQRNLDNGNTVGIAWLSSVCTSYKYNVCQDFSNNAAQKRVLLAHEMGHNFGANHDAQGQGTIMAPSVNNTNAWSSQSISVISNFINGAGCLATNCTGEDIGGGPQDDGGGGSTPTCNDGIQNGNESGVDCGGSLCDPCAGPGPTCDDGIQNGDEQGMDCGGPDCPPCQGPPPSCTDGIQNGNEVGVDCGGPCPTCNDACASEGQDSFFEHIKSVTIGSTTYQSGDDNGYRDFTNRTFYIKTEIPTIVGLTPGYGEQVYEENWVIWIDLNQDNIFSSSEAIFKKSGENRVTGNITIPGNSKMTTRMRVALRWGSDPLPCSAYDYGEVEDFRIQIDPLGGSSCSDGYQNGDETDVDCGGSCPPCESGYVKFESGEVASVGSGWKKVNLSQFYNSMVVVATPVYPNGNRSPVVTRIRNAGGNSFEIKLQSPGGTVSSLNVHYIVVEEGVYTESQHGIQMEAVRYNSMLTSSGLHGWKINPVSPSIDFERPVVVGQVITYNDERWSTFWSSHTTNVQYTVGKNRISVGKHIGESPSQFRNNETIGYVILEAGSGILGGMAYEAGISDKIVQSFANSGTGYTHSLSAMQTRGRAVLSVSGMKGLNGCWPVLALNDPVSNGRLRMAVDEDVLNDAERWHLPERVAFLVLASTGNIDDSETDNREIVSSDPEHLIYPNPVTDILTLLLHTEGEVIVQVRSLANRLLDQKQGQQRIQFDTQNYPDGIYYLNIVGQNGVRSVKKFIKTTR